jgi:predicted phosphodiesterase
MKYRFVQLSDIHFGQERGGTRVVHEDVRRKLIDDARELAGLRGAPDLVIIVGDTAFAGKDEEYKRAAEWLDEVTRAVGCRDTDVRVVPGNHDCDRDHITSVTKMVNGTLRSRDVQFAHATLEEMARGPEEQHPLLPKLGAYRKFALSYNSDFESVGRPLWTKDFPLADGIVLRLVGMNSVQVCSANSEDQPGTMVLGSQQYILPDETHVVYATLLHHPLEWYLDKAEAKQYLHNRARVIMVGHEHIPEVNKTVNLVGNERLDVFSGATNPPEQGQLYRYAYNWIEVSLLEEPRAYKLHVCVLPRVWVPARTAFAADRDRLGGQELAEFDLQCPNLRPTAIHAPAIVAKSRAHDATDAPIANGTIAASKKQEDPPMSEVDEAALERLRLLFWRYLDWQQRLKVLVQADVLPATADQPVPQTLERLAIDRAKQQGKLAAIWEAMNPFLPPERQQAKNPFKDSEQTGASC